MPVVNVPEPSETLPPVVPPPEREAIVSLKLLRSKITAAVLSRLIALLSAITPDAPNCKVPAVKVVVPV